MKINIQSTKHAISWQGASYCLHDSSFFKDVCCKLRDFSGIAFKYEHLRNCWLCNLRAVCVALLGASGAVREQCLELSHDTQRETTFSNTTSEQQKDFLNSISNSPEEVSTEV